MRYHILDKRSGRSTTIGTYSTAQAQFFRFIESMTGLDRDAASRILSRDGATIDHPHYKFAIADENPFGEKAAS